jgi:hypothetical protein
MRSPEGVPEGEVEDLLFVASAIASAIIGPTWGAIDRHWQGWADARLGPPGLKIDVRQIDSPAAMFLPDEVRRSDLLVSTTSGGETFVAIRTPWRQFMSLRPTKADVSPHSTATTPWDGTWEGGPLAAVLDAPFIVINRDIPGEIALMTLGHHPRHGARIGDLEDAYALLVPLIGQLRRVSSMINRGADITEVAEKLRASLPEDIPGTPEQIRWALTASMTLFHSAMTVWPRWFAEVRGTNDAMTYGPDRIGKA